MKPETASTDHSNAERFRALILGAQRQAARANRECLSAPSVSGSDRMGRDADGADTLPGIAIPGYGVVRELHRGGQGVVYKAVQQSTRRRVAVKVMREGPFAGGAERARFEREVQVLAQLRHPNIVAIHDSGQAAGHDYFVMDLIEGIPLDRFIAERQLPAGGIVRLFAVVCDAVNAAHLRGVIHRDLKPGNILVESSGVPHVLDFGLAKMAVGGFEINGSRPDVPRLDMTATGQFVGSLHWAAPEQAEGASHKIDLRTDVYSLGVVLFQCLTGAFPHRIDGSFAEALHAVMHLDPIRPRTLNVAIDDEIETIVLKCLSKDPDRRYQTAGDLARDLRRYLAGEPIEAKRDSAAYVLRKTLTRYRVHAAIAGAFAVLLLVSTIVSGVLYFRAESQRRFAQDSERRAQENAAQARRSADETRAVADFQARMLRDVDVTAMAEGIRQRYREKVRSALERQGIGEWPNRRPRTAAEVDAEMSAFDERAAAAEAIDVARRVMDEFVLAPAAASIERQFADQPLVAAQIHEAISAAYQGLGMYAAGEAGLRTALELRQRALGGEHALVAQSLHALGKSLRLQERLDEAEPMLREALRLEERSLGPDNPALAMGMNELGMALFDKGDKAHAEPLLRGALALARKPENGPRPHLLDCINSLALLLDAQGDDDAAEALYREALEVTREVMGSEHPDVGTYLNNLGMLRYDVGDYTGAEQSLREALAISRKALGDENPEVIAGMSNLGAVLLARGDYHAAEQFYRDALALLSKLRGGDSPALATAMNNLAGVLDAKGRHAESERLYRESLALLRRRLGDDHPLLVRCLNNLAGALRSRRDFAAAEPLYREALELARRLHPGEHEDVAAVLNNLGTCLSAAGDLAAAEPLLREALAMRRHLMGDRHPKVAATLAGLASLLAHKREPSAAEPLYRESLVIYEAALPAGHPLIAGARNDLGAVLTTLGRYAEAEAALLDAWRMREAAHAPQSDLRGTIENIVTLFQQRDAAEPGHGFDAIAAEWSAKLTTAAPVEQDSP